MTDLSTPDQREAVEVMAWGIARLYCPWNDMPDLAAAASASAMENAQAALRALHDAGFVVGRADSFQDRVQPWMLACFGNEISQDRIERNHRFLEEALEAVQSNGCSRSEAHQLVDYVFDRPVGELNQEIGGVMVTLAALCLASRADMHLAGETELARVWTKVEQIRAKQAAKPKHSPLPGPSQPKGTPHD